MLEAAKWQVNAYNSFIMKLGAYSVSIPTFSTQNLNNYTWHTSLPISCPSELQCQGMTGYSWRWPSPRLSK